MAPLVPDCQHNYYGVADMQEQLTGSDETLDYTGELALV